MDTNLDIAWRYWRDELAKSLGDGRLSGGPREPSPPGLDQILSEVDDLRNDLEDFPDDTVFSLDTDRHQYELADVLRGLQARLEVVLLDPTRQALVPKARVIAEKAARLIPLLQRAGIQVLLPEGYIAEEKSKRAS